MNSSHLAIIRWYSILFLNGSSGLIKPGCSSIGGCSAEVFPARGLYVRFFLANSPGEIMWSQSLTLFLYSVARSIMIFSSVLSNSAFGIRSLSRPLAIRFTAFSSLMV